MHEQDRFAGAAIATPLAGGDVDIPRLASHLKSLIGQGLDGGTLFGTTGECTAFSWSERLDALSGCLVAGIDAPALGVGVFAPSAAEAAEQSQSAIELGCRVLLAPPYYFKAVPEEGVYEWFAAVLGKIAAPQGRIHLYHIPSLTGVPLLPAMCSRLQAEFPHLVAGVKDSGCNLAETRERLEASGTLEVLVGFEPDLAPAVAAGAAGAISGLANVVPEVVAAVARTGKESADLTSLTEQVAQHPVVPAIKALMAHATGRPQWADVRPPLCRLAPDAAARLCAHHDSLFAGSGAARSGPS